MPTITRLAGCDALNQLTIIKLAVQLLERSPGWSAEQHALAHVALGATDRLSGRRPESGRALWARLYSVQAEHLQDDDRADDVQDIVATHGRSLLDHPGFGEQVSYPLAAAGPDSSD